MSRIFSNKISLYELVNIIAVRTKHIEDGSPIYVDFDGTPEQISIEEIRLKKCPLSIVRKFNDITETWEVNELIVDLSELVV